MILEIDKLKEDSKMSNSVMVGLRHPDCPIQQICLYVLKNPKGIVDQCIYMNHGNTVPSVCLYKKVNHDEATYGRSN